MRVREVNKAKDVLKTNRNTMSIEVKKRMIKHIKHKMTIIGLIEDELKMDSQMKKQQVSSTSSSKQKKRQ